MGFTCSWLKQFVDLLVGEGENAAKRVAAAFINSMGTDILRGMGSHLAHGDDATDAGSDATKTVITIRSDSARTGVIQSGDSFLVRDSLGTGWWYGTATADNVLSFNTTGIGVDGKLVRGAAPGNYALPAFIDGLHIVIIPQSSFYIPKYLIDFTDANDGAVQTDDLRRPGGAVLETDMAANEALFAIAHTGAGAQAAASVPIDALEEAIFEDINYANILANGGAEAGECAAGDVEAGAPVMQALPYYWEPVFGREPTFTYLTDANVYEGRYCCVAGYGAANHAIDLHPDPLEFDVTQHRNEWIALSVKVRVTVVDSIQVGFNGAVGGEDLAAVGGTVGAYVTLTHVMQIDPLETAITARFVNAHAGGNTTEFDAAITVLGDKPVAYQRSTWEADAIKARYASVFDLAINGYFTHWTNGAGAATDPDFWNVTGTATCRQEVAAANVARGDFSAEVMLPDNASDFDHWVGANPLGTTLIENLRGHHVTAKFKVKWIAGTRNLHATLETDAPGNSQNIIINLPLAVDFVSCANIGLVIDPAATNLVLSFGNLDGGVVSAIEFYLDDVQITPTPWPCAPVIPCYWTIQTKTWNYYGVLDPTLGDVDMAVGDVYAFTTNLGIQAGCYAASARIFVEAEAGPGVGPPNATLFMLTAGGALNDSITLTNPATQAQVHNPGMPRLIPSDNLACTVNMGGAPVEDVVLTWVLLTANGDGSEL